MALSVTHAAVVVTADDGTSEVGSNEWNAAHTISITTALSPDSNGGAALGTTALNWSNLFLGNGSTINFSNGDITFEHATGSILFNSASAGGAAFEFKGLTTQAPHLGVGISTDTRTRANIGVDTSNNPYVSLGPGGVTARDTFWTRAGAASWQAGDYDAAAPVAQTLQVQSVVAGTSNTAGVDWTFVGSKGTGTGAGGVFIFKTAAAGSTGSTQNTSAEVLRIGIGAVTITGQAGASALTLTGGTQTTSNPILSLTQTWNAGAVTFTGLKLNVTDTTSAAASLLLDLQVGAASKFNVDKTGIGMITTRLCINGTASTDVGLRKESSAHLGIVAGDNSAYGDLTAKAVVANAALTSNAATVYLNNNTTAQVQFGSAGDPTLLRVASNLLELNNGSAAGAAQFRLNASTVAALPAASATYKGARATVSDANSNTFFASVVAATSTSTAQIVPVFCDGAAWKIG